MPPLGNVGVASPLPVDPEAESAKEMASELSARVGYLRRKRDALTQDIMQIEKAIDSINMPAQEAAPSLRAETWPR